MSVSPSSGTILADDSKSASAIITPRAAGHLQATLHCLISDGEAISLQVRPLDLVALTRQVECTLLGPTLVVDDPSIDFGLISLGDDSSHRITFTNTSEVRRLLRNMNINMPGPHRVVF